MTGSSLPGIAFSCGGGEGATVFLVASDWTPAQGEPVLVEMTWLPGADNVSMVWKKRAYPMAPGPGGRLFGLVGVDLEDPPGPADFSVEGSVRGVPCRMDTVFRVRERTFPVQRLTLPRAMAEFDAQTVARIRREADALSALFSAGPAAPLWRLPLVTPVEAFRPAGFGSRRFINGEPRAPHAGVDITLPEGTPVRAIADGTVVFAGEQFLGGKSVVLDHGGGVFSLYYHLREFSVADHPADGAAGQRVRGGEPIGSVGATGRAAGPHLHFGVRAAGGRVDPAALFTLGPH